MANQTQDGLHFIPDCPISKLTPYKRNPRLNDQAVKAVSESIGRFGAVAPIIVDKDFNIVCGHTRYKAALERGNRTFPVLVVPHLVGDEFKAYNVADNQTATIADWDMPELAAIIKELEATEFPVDVLGFDDKELQEIMDSATGNTGLTDPDDVPEPPEEPVVKTGDLWLLGEHRLLCGDSTKAEEVARVMRGEKARLFATDPPYGCNAGNIGFTSQRDDIEPIRKDDLEGKEMQAFLESVFRCCMPYLADDAAWYLWHPMLTQGYFAAAAAAAAADLIIHRQIIWVKEQFIFGRGDYHWRHELCFYGWKQGHRPRFFGERNQDTVWNIPWGEKRGEIGHPTAKPVQLFAIPMRNHTERNDVCCDPFSGSGTTIIAAETLGRKAYCLEIEPRYVQVSLEHWAAFTGKMPVLERTGKTLAEVKQERMNV